MNEESHENKERNDIADIFDTIDDAIPLVNIIAKLAELGYSEPGKIVVSAIREDILYVDTIEYIEDSITVYMALTVSGEKLWRSVHTVS